MSQQREGPCSPSSTEGPYKPHLTHRHPKDLLTCAQGAREAETQSSPMVKFSASSDACPETRGLKPGWGSLCHVWVPLPCTFVVELQTLPSKGTGTSLEAKGLQMSGKSPSWTPSDSCFLFISCFSARLPPKHPRNQAAELTNAASAVVLVSGYQVSAFIAKLYVTSCHALSAPAGTGHPRQACFCPCHSHTWGQGFTWWAGLGRQQEAEGQSCLQFSRMNRGASLQREIRFLQI